MARPGACRVASCRIDHAKMVPNMIGPSTEAIP